MNKNSFELCSIAQLSNQNLLGHPVVPYARVIYTTEFMAGKLEPGKPQNVLKIELYPSSTLTIVRQFGIYDNC